MRPVTIVAAAVFSVVALMHLLRLFYGWEVIVDGIVIPLWASVLPLVIAGGLAWALWREAGKS